MKALSKNLKDKVIKHKKLIENFSSLSVFQMLNILLPLISYPYLIRVLGKETYGLVLFAQAVIGYLLILVGFGFEISATKEISIYRENKEKLSEIVSSVFIIKGVFFFLALLVLSISLYFIPRAKGNESLFLLTMWICLSDFMLPIWYYQGIEKMKYITYITVVSRFFFVLMIFIFIESSSDYLLVPIINGLGALIAGIISLIIIFKRHNVRFKLQSSDIVLYYLKESVPIFLSNVSVRLYVSTNRVVIGAYLGMSDLSYYDLGEKIVSILKTPQSIISQALFPKISKDKNINFVKKGLKISLFLNFFLALVAVAFSKNIVVLLAGEEMLPSVIVVNLLALSVPIIAISNVIGIQILIPFGKVKVYSRIIFASGIIYLCQMFLVWLLWNINIYSLATITVTSEIVVTALMFHSYKNMDVGKEI